MSDTATEPARAADQVDDNKISDVTSADDKKNGTETTNGTKDANGDSKPRQGIVSDAASLPPSDDPKAIKKQVEFYFTDSNLRFDKYLWGLVTKENKWVQIKALMSFNRMKRFKAEAVAPALEDSELLELDEKKENIRRRVPLAPPSADNKSVDKAVDRSLYIRGFGSEGKKTQFEIEDYFESTGIAINAVRLRRNDHKVFKGSVFVEFKQQNGLKLWMDLKDKPQWKGVTPALLTVEEEREDNRTEFSGTTQEKAVKDAERGLKYMSKKTFVDMKSEDIKSGKIKATDYNKGKSQNKFDAFAPKSSGGHSGKSYRDRRPDLRNDKWNRGEQVRDRDGHRSGNRGRGRHGDRNNRDRDNNRSRDRDRNDHSGGRGGRGGNRGGRDGRKGSDDSDSRQKVDEKGVPIVRALSHSPEPNTHLGERKSSPKRQREEDGTSSPDNFKKIKTEASTEKDGTSSLDNFKKIKTEASTEKTFNGTQKRQREDDDHEKKTTSPPSLKKIKVEVKEEVAS